MLYLDALSRFSASGDTPLGIAARDAADTARAYGPRDGDHGRYVAADPFGRWSIVRDPWWPLHHAPYYVTADGYAWPCADLEPCADCGRPVYFARGRYWHADHHTSRPRCYMGGTPGDPAHHAPDQHTADPTRERPTVA